LEVDTTTVFKGSIVQSRPNIGSLAPEFRLSYDNFLLTKAKLSGATTIDIIFDSFMTDFGLQALT
jgi:hypothetical protein